MHPSVSSALQPAAYIDTEEALHAFLDQWLPMVEDEALALDIEEDRGVRYRPSVALVQVSACGHDAILDPLTLGSDVVTPALRDLLHCSRRVLVHGGHNDVAGLRRDFNVAPLHIGDTQIAARFLGIRQFGLSNLLEAHFGLAIDKKERRSDWGKRPLSRSQLRYAQRDTTYLEALWDQLFEQASEAGWRDAVLEECAALQRTPAEEMTFDPHGWLKIKGMRKQNDSVQRRAAQIWTWRDHFGEQHNVHPSHVLPTWAVEQVAMRGFHWVTQQRKIREKLLQISPTACDQFEQDVREIEPVRMKKRATTSREHDGQQMDVELQRRRYDALHTWRAKEAERTQLDSGWLAPRSVLDVLTHADPDALTTLADTTDVRQWRLDRYASVWRDILIQHR